MTLKLIMFNLFKDLIIIGLGLDIFVSTIGEFESYVSLTILIVFSVIRAASLWEDIKKKKIENEERRFNLKVKEWDDEQHRKQQSK